MAQIPDFPITIDKRDVWKLLEEYEERNTRTVIDVNTSEYDLVSGDRDTSKQNIELKNKIDRVVETINVLQKRKDE